MTKENEMPIKFRELAGYNTRVSNGIMHTEEYKKRMKRLQIKFNKWVKLKK